MLNLKSKMLSSLLVSGLIVGSVCSMKRHSDEVRNEALLTASQNNDLAGVRQALKQGADVNAKDMFSETALMNAAQLGFLEVLKELLYRGTDISIKNNYGETALDLAKKFSHSEIKQVLEDHQGDLDAKLLKAASQGNLEELKRLLDMGADFKVQHSMSKTSLMVAAERGHLDIVKELLSKDEPYLGAAKSVDGFGNTALVYAAVYNHISIVKELLEKIGNIPGWYTSEFSAKVEEFGLWRALKLATQHNHFDVVQELLKREPDRNEIQFYAARNGHLNLIRELAKRGSLNFYEEEEDILFGNTVLMRAAREGHLDIITELINLGAPVRGKNTNGSTALHAAAEYNKLFAVRELLNRGAFVNARDLDGRTPVMLAASCGSEEIVAELLSRGANINDKDNDNKTVLMAAAQFSRKITKEALRHGANVNDISASGTTALIEAVINEDALEEDKEYAEELVLGIVEELLDKGAKINIADNQNRTALEYADEFGYDQVEELLLDYHGLNVKKKFICAGVTSIDERLEEAVNRGNAPFVKYLLKTYMFRPDYLKRMLESVKKTYKNAKWP